MFSSLILLYFIGAKPGILQEVFSHRHLFPGKDIPLQHLHQHIPVRQGILYYAAVIISAADLFSRKWVPVNGNEYNMPLLPRLLPHSGFPERLHKSSGRMITGTVDSINLTAFCQNTGKPRSGFLGHSPSYQRECTEYFHIFHFVLKSLFSGFPEHCSPHCRNRGRPFPLALCISL